MGNNTSNRTLRHLEKHHTSDAHCSRQQGHRSDTDQRIHSGGASAKRSAHHVPGFKSWSFLSTQKSVPGAPTDLLEQRSFGSSGPERDQVFCRVGRIGNRFDESSSIHERKI